MACHRGNLQTKHEIQIGYKTIIFIANVYYFHGSVRQWVCWVSGLTEHQRLAASPGIAKPDKPVTNSLVETSPPLPDLHSYFLLSVVFIGTLGTSCPVQKHLLLME